MPKCIFVNTFYVGFLTSHYRRHEGLERAGYAEQLESLNAANFGDSSFYSDGLRRAGWLCADLIVNCAPLQAAWARENGSGASGLAVAVEQIRKHRPDVIYCQDLASMPGAFFEAVRGQVGLVAGQIASPLAPQTPLEAYDLLFTSFPHYVDRFRAAGRTAYYQPLAFAPRVLEQAGNKPWGERSIALSFVGGISPVHREGAVLVDYLARHAPLRCWGYGAEALPADSPARTGHGGEVWGNDMFARLGDSKITVNRHADCAERFANNMRLFEATGCGALLVTDYKDNLDELFRVGEEVVAYRSREECLALVQYYLGHPEEAARIAQAGQRRTLADHRYDQRMAHTAELLERHLRYRAERARHAGVDLRGISTNHRAIRPEQVTEAQRCAWQSELIPARQRALVQGELEAMYGGRVLDAYQKLADLLAGYLGPGGSVLEVGCASGYYYEVLEYLLRRRLDYTGVDYSAPLVAMARDYYPRVRFEQADGAALPFADGHYAVVVSSCVLLHVTNYAAHIAEAARVARRAVVLHRTPVCRRGPTRYASKLAYGVETVELCFSEQELLGLCDQHGLELVGVVELSADRAADCYCVEYVLDKRGPSERRLGRRRAA